MIVPGLKDGDLSLLMVVRKTFPAWFLGVVGGAGALTAMVPAAIIILTAATLFAKNVWRPLVTPGMTDHQVTLLARVMVVALGVISLYLAIYQSTTLVSLLLLGYAGATQFFPGVVLGLCWPRITTAGVFAGIAIGVTCAALLILSKNDPILGVNAGFAALCLNFAGTVVVSLITRRQPNGFGNSQ
jgi:SSS family solute:Na+ symporter